MYLYLLQDTYISYQFPYDFKLNYIKIGCIETYLHPMWGLNPRPQA